MMDKRTSVKDIQQDTTKPELKKKCLELIELWIGNVKGRKWQDVVEAANKSGFSGLATALAAEFAWPESKKPPNERENGGNNYRSISVCAS